VVRRRLALFLLCLASFMAVVDNTIVTIALPAVRRDLGFSGADAGWVLNGYVLAFGGLLLLCGRAADLWGRRRLFLAGLALFGLSSLVGGLANLPWVLVVGRVLQGVGAAAFEPASLSLQLGNALGLAIVATVAATAAAVVGSGGGEDLLVGLRWGLVVCVGIVVLALPITLFGLRGR
jgi:MFS family permease